MAIEVITVIPNFRRGEKRFKSVKKKQIASAADSAPAPF
jgi:hypothetical protein